MNRLEFVKWPHLSGCVMAVRNTLHALSIQIYAGRVWPSGYTSETNWRMFVGDSALSNLVQATTTPQGAQIVSTQ